MDKIIKLQSNQSGPFTSKKNLIDFTLPEGNVISLKDSYINLVMTVDTTETAGDASVYNAFARLGGLTGADPTIPNACLVKNAHFSSTQKGMLESIRRVDVLRGVLDSYEKDEFQKMDSSYYGLNSSRRATDMALSPFRELHGSGTVVSKSVTHDVKIKLESLFNIGMMEEFSTEQDSMGQCKINLECNFDKLDGAFTMGATDGIWTNKGTFETVTSTTAAQVITTLQTSFQYNDLKDSPFWCGQKLAVSSVNDGATAVVADHIISEIGINDANQRLYITFADAIATIATIGQELTVITCVGVDPATNPVTVQSAELVLSMAPEGAQAPTEFAYTTWTTEEDNGSGRGAFIKQYQLEAEAINMVVAFPLPITSSYGYTDYRIRVDNKEQTNRPVKLSTPIAYDRINRFFLNRGKDVGNVTELVRKWNVNDADAGTISNAILETLPMTDNQKLVNIEINGGGLNDFIIFKEITKEV